MAGIIAVSTGITTTMGIHNFLYQQNVEKDKILYEGSRIIGIITDLKHMSDSECDSAISLNILFNHFEGLLKVMIIW
jgi:hypothetical protein